MRRYLLARAAGRAPRPIRCSRVGVVRETTPFGGPYRHLVIVHRVPALPLEDVDECSDGIEGSGVLGRGLLVGVEQRRYCSVTGDGDGEPTRGLCRSQF